MGLFLYIVVTMNVTIVTMIFGVHVQAIGLLIVCKRYLHVH